MARILPRSLANVRHLLLALLALGLVLRMGAGCEAMAAVATTSVAQQSHCADMPGKSGMPAKIDAAACALCAALPDTAPAAIGAPPLVTAEHSAGLSEPLADLAGGPAPPPLRNA